MCYLKVGDNQNSSERLRNIPEAIFSCVVGAMGNRRADLQKDPLPLPRFVSCGNADGQYVGRSRATVHRHRCRLREEEEIDRIVRSLSDLYCGEPGQKLISHRPQISKAQQLCFDHIHKSVRSAGRPPDDLSEAVARKELRLAGFYFEPEQGPAAYQRHLVSLPPPGTTMVTLEESWGTGGSEFVEATLRRSIFGFSSRGKCHGIRGGREVPH